MWFWIIFPLLLNKDSVKPVPVEINFSYQFSRPKIPHTVFEVVKQKKNHKKRHYETRREQSEACGKWSKDKQWKPSEWRLAFTFLHWVPHPLEIIDCKGRLVGRLPEPWSWRTGGLRPLSCICKCATAAFPAQSRKQQLLGCKAHLFGFFTGEWWMQREQHLWSLGQGLLQLNCVILNFIICSIRSTRNKGSSSVGGGCNPTTGKGSPVSDRRSWIVSLCAIKKEPQLLRGADSVSVNKRKSPEVRANWQKMMKKYPWLSTVRK